MKKIITVFLIIVLMLRMCVFADAKLRTPDYGFVEKIGDKTYFVTGFDFVEGFGFDTNEVPYLEGIGFIPGIYEDSGHYGTLYSCDENWDNIEVVDSLVRGTSKIYSDGIYLYYLGYNNNCLYQYNTVTKERKLFDFDISLGHIELIKDDIYSIPMAWWDGENIISDFPLYKYDTSDGTTTEIAPAYKMLGIVDDCIYLFDDRMEDYSIILSKISPTGEKTDLRIDNFIVAVMHNDLIYVYDSDSAIIVLDKDFKEIRRVNFDLYNSPVRRNYDLFSDIFIDDTYLYDCGIRINHKTGEVSKFPENSKDFPYGYWYHVDKDKNEMYFIEINGEDFNILDTETNILVKNDLKDKMIKANLKNTLLWKLVKEKYPQVTDDEYVEARTQNESSLLNMLVSFE